MKSPKLVIGICSVGEKYHKLTKELLEQLNVRDQEIHTLVLTDRPEEFFELSTHILKYTFKHTPYRTEVFSFHDKRLIFEEGFKISNLVLLLDADHYVVKEKIQNINLEKIYNLPDGAYPQIVWRSPADCSMEYFLEGLTSRVPYGIAFREYCNHKGYSLDNAELIQESFILIKETEDFKKNKFLQIWEDLQNFCEKKDKERFQDVLGYGEGYSIGVGLYNAGIEVKNIPECVGELISTFKHIAWEPIY